MSAFLCMTPAEYALWLDAARSVRNGGRTPCTDCPMAFHLAMKAQGRCDRKPILTGTRYASDDEAGRSAARRKWRREWRARNLERARAADRERYHARKAA